MSGGANCKNINLVIHDNAQGVSFWTPATDSELHGCIIYDNGWKAPDRGHGHAIYTQNQNGTKLISDCIMTGGFSYTMHAYGSSRAYVDNFVIVGNIAYDAGTFLVGGGKPSNNIRVHENYLHNVSMQIGYNAPNNVDCYVSGNVINNGGLNIVRYQKAENKDNLIVSRGASRPTEQRIVVRRNAYDRNRANVAVFNWTNLPAAAIKPGDLLAKGDRFVLLEPKDFFGKPIAMGLYDGQAVTMPLKGEFTAAVIINLGGGAPQTRPSAASTEPSKISLGEAWRAVLEKETRR
jgi:hypothetical protein